MPTATILVIEDDLATAGLIRDALEIEGYRVLHAVGDAGIAAARDGRPRVILLDIDMPGMGGPEVSRHLRADPHTIVHLHNRAWDGYAKGRPPEWSCWRTTR